jgi:succinyl-diaminopimelate desuccinylase
VPFVILGPGDDREAHKADEHIELSSVALFAGLYAGYIEDHCR